MVFHRRDAEAQRKANSNLFFSAPRRLCGGLFLALLATGTVYLAFDTGNMAQTENIARILKQEQVRAVFFLANE